LHGDMTDSSCPAMNQHTLAGADIGAIHQAFPRGDECQRQCGRLAHVQCARLQREQPRVDRNVFGHGALGAANPARHPEDLVARGKVIDRFSRLDDGAGQIQTKHCGQRLTGMGGGARCDLEVERIDPCGMDFDQHLSFGRGGTGDMTQGQRCLGGFRDRGKHGVIHDVEPL